MAKDGDVEWGREARGALSQRRRSAMSATHFFSVRLKPRVKGGRMFVDAQGSDDLPDRTRPPGEITPPVTAWRSPQRLRLPIIGRRTCANRHAEAMANEPMFDGANPERRVASGERIAALAAIRSVGVRGRSSNSLISQTGPCSVTPPGVRRCVCLPSRRLRSLRR